MSTSCRPVTSRRPTSATWVMPSVRSVASNSMARPSRFSVRAECSCAVVAVTADASLFITRHRCVRLVVTCPTTASDGAGSGLDTGEHREPTDHAHHTEQAELDDLFGGEVRLQFLLLLLGD